LLSFSHARVRFNFHAISFVEAIIGCVASALLRRQTAESAAFWARILHGVPRFREQTRKREEPINAKQNLSDGDRNRILFLAGVSKGYQFEPPNRMSLHRLASKEFGVSKEVI
jgi:hypothetical protein